MKNKGKERLQFDLTTEEAELFDKLVEEEGFRTRSELLRKMLKREQLLHQKTKKGWECFLKKGDNTIQLMFI
jgi:metal-responsive CopG/Arc/MetJ family transcriptional regulator